MHCPEGHSTTSVAVLKISIDGILELCCKKKPIKMGVGTSTPLLVGQTAPTTAQIAQITANVKASQAAGVPVLSYTAPSSTGTTGTSTAITLTLPEVFVLKQANPQLVFTLTPAQQTMLSDLNQTGGVNITSNGTPGTSGYSGTITVSTWSSSAPSQTMTSQTTVYNAMYSPIGVLNSTVINFPTLSVVASNAGTTLVQQTAPAPTSTTNSVLSPIPSVPLVPSSSTTSSTTSSTSAGLSTTTIVCIVMSVVMAILLVVVLILRHRSLSATTIAPE